MQKNDIVKLSISNYGCNAEGVGYFDGKVVFVPYSLLNETITALIIKSSSKYQIGKIVDIQNPNQERISPMCPYFSKCGGCQLQHTTYKNSLAIKTSIVQKTINSIGKIEYTVPQTIASDKEYHYRNKIAMPINPKTRRLGMYRLSSHNIVDIDDCLLQQSKISALIDTFNQYLKVSKTSIYNDATKTGILKSLVAREINDNLLVTVVINSEKLDDVDVLKDILTKKFNKIGLSLNINKLKNNVILSDTFVDVFGQNEVEVFENGIVYSISNKSFLQVNNEIKQQMYQKIFDETNNQSVIDAYSGAGLLSAMIAKHAKQVYGIEIVKPATELANKLKEKNNISNLTNINGDCSFELPKILDSLSNDEKENLTVVLDPPRKGCAKDVIESILKTSPKKIIYMSCDPSTLARDLNILLSSNKYKIKYIQPYDMFPQTKHVETLSVLVKEF